MAEGRDEADKALDHFLAKDREAVLAFYDFLAEHWQHTHTSNPSESTFATARHRARASQRLLQL